MPEEFQYEKTLKNRTDNEFVNVQMYYLLTSKAITKWLYRTPITSHQVILISLIFGILSSVLIIQDSELLVILGAILLFYKNVLDKVDGSLARVRGTATRRGRFYDSIADFIVSLCLFAAIAYKLSMSANSFCIALICLAALVTSKLQCSFFIYYDISYIKYSGMDTINRLIESVTEEDLKEEDKFTLLLQRIFLIIYGWQDKIFAYLDKYFYGKLKTKYVKNEKQLERLNSFWYYHRSFLAIASVLAIGTHMVMIALFAVIGKMEYYLVLNLILLNLLLIFAIVYHYASVKSKMKLNQLSI
jgi:phosphatidylglycerophosphate synthase